MAFRMVIVSLLLMSCAISIADDPPTAKEPTVKELLARIEKLEQRILELETGSQPASRNVTPGTKGIQSSPLTEFYEAYRLYKGAVPRVFQRPVPRVPAPIPQQDYGNPSTQIVPIEQRENVPSSWHRHKFNGDYYYTIPLSSTK